MNDSISLSYLLSISLSERLVVLEAYLKTKDKMNKEVPKAEKAKVKAKCP